ncbi:MAG: hypothetical protein ABIS20_21935 [Thermoanaerobaculia bacterium]
MRWTRMAGFVGLVLLAFPSARAQQGEGPVVIHAEVPACDLARRARISGLVLIRVTIDQQGKVTSTTFEQELPFTTECSEAAAEKWLFAPSDRAETREAHLSFLFTGETKETDEPSHEIISFDDPWTLRLAYAQSTISRLPREDGKIPEKRCPVHGEVMAVEVVPGWGGRRVHVVDESPEKQRKQAAAKEAYWKASENLFPETNWHFSGGGCTDQARKGEVYYCQACREAEREWLEIYPEWNPHKE